MRTRIRKVRARQARVGPTLRVVEGDVATQVPRMTVSRAPASSVTEAIEESVGELQATELAPQRISHRERLNLEREQAEAEQKMGNVEITGTYFYPIGLEELSKLSVCNVTSDLPEGANTVNDPRMGTINRQETCITCQRSGYDCPGHYGMITLNQWFLNPTFATAAVHVLQSVCSACSHLLCDRETLGNALSLNGQQRLKAIAKKSVNVMCTRVHDGVECRNHNPLYKREKDSYIVTCKYKIPGSTTIDTDKNVQDIFNIFSQIPKEDLTTMGLHLHAHPKNWVMRALPVIPECVRPPVYQDGSLRSDHLTGAYMDLIRHNQRIDELKKGPRTPNYEKDLSDAIRDFWFHLSHLMNNSDGKYTRGKGVKVHSVKDRFDGKGGIPRGHSMGKRVNHCGRTVIGPASLDFGEVALPNAWKKIHTVQVKVTKYNIEEITRMYLDGKIASIVKCEGWVNTKGRTKKLYVPKLGDVVERYVRDGDWYLMNRQPTLHKQSMMAHRAKFGKDRSRVYTITTPVWTPESTEVEMCTARLRPDDTTPYNADFDGDEMNAHLPQGENARVEAMGIAYAGKQIMDPQKNKPMYGKVYNELSSAYVLSMIETIDPEDWEEGISYITDDKDLKTLDARLSDHGVKKYSGPGLFSALLPDTFHYDRGDVKIRDGILLQGKITKKDIGASSKAIIHRMYRNYPRSRVERFLTDSDYVLGWFLSVYGFTVGYKDFIAPNQASVDAIIDKEVKLAQHKIDDLGKLPKGATELEKEYHESKIRNALNNVSRIGRKIGLEELSPTNPLNIMKNSGAKGSDSNTGQMVASMGQQFIMGNRPVLSITNGTRSLPYYQPNSDDIRARGFIETNFMQGMNPGAFVFHMAASLVGLINTAVTTADIGSLHHVLNKVSEDFKIEYDGSVRNVAGAIFQFIYSDGFDPKHLIQTSSRSTGDVYSFIDLKYTISMLNSRLGYDEV